MGLTGRSRQSYGIVVKDSRAWTSTSNPVEVATIVGIVGRDGGYTAKEATACVIVPTVNATHVTPHSEAFQGVVWHLFVSHPSLKTGQTKGSQMLFNP